MSVSDAPAVSTEARDQEIDSLQDELIIAFLNKSLPVAAFNKILTSAIVLADPSYVRGTNAGSATATAERALARLREAVELIEEAAV